MSASACGAARLAVDDAQRVLDDRAALAQVAARRDHLPARRHDVLHDGEAAAVDVAALGELAGAVGLRLLAHEQRRDAR